MTRAERAPIDSWVHVAPTRPLPWPLIICNVLFTLCMACTSVLALLFLLGVLPPMNPDTTAVGYVVSLLVASGRRSMPLIKLDLDPAAGVPGDAQMLTAEGYTVPGDALYSALRWYQAHPEARWELGRTEGQRRIDAWRDDALAQG